MGRKRHNPEKRAWKGKSYKKNGERIDQLKQKPYQRCIKPNCDFCDAGETIAMLKQARDAWD